MKDNKTELEEASLYGSSKLDPKTEFDRRARLARLSDEARKAAIYAEKKGDSELAATLNMHADDLDDLLSRTPKIDKPGATSAPGDDPAAEKSDEEGHSGEGEGKSADRPADKPEKPEEKKPEDTSDGEKGGKGKSDFKLDTKDAETDGGEPGGEPGDSDSDAESDDTSSADDSEDNSSDASGESEDDSGESDNAGDGEDEDASDGGTKKSDDESGESEEGKAESDDESEDDSGESDDEADDESEEGPEEDPGDEPGVPKVKDNKVLRNPFDKSPLKQEISREMQQKIDRGDLELESELDALKRILGGLTGKAREGAIAAINKIKADRGMHESLSEAIEKDYREMSDEEFESMVNDILDDIDKVKPHKYDMDHDTKVQEIHDEAEDAAEADFLDREDAANKRKETAAEEERQRKEKEKYAGISASIADFKANFFRSIKDQVDTYEEEEDTWANLDRRADEDPSVVKQGHRIEDKLEEIKPKIAVYFDQSGSWGDDEVRKGMKAVSCVKSFEDQGEIEMRIYYFSAIGPTPDQAQARSYGSQECWDLVVDHIKENGFNNVVIITDSDIGYSYGYDGHYGCIKGEQLNLKGELWFIWKRSTDLETIKNRYIGYRTIKAAASRGVHHYVLG